LAGECCDGLECIADINIATFSAELSCGERFGSCAVCGEGMVVGSPDADAQLPLPGFTFTCGQLEQAGQFGVFDTTLCQFIPNLISGICECIPATDGGDDMDGSEAPTDAPSMVPSSLVGADVPTLAPSVPSDEPGPSPETEAPSGSRSIVSTAMVVLSTTFVMMMISLTSSIQ
jgi:hypothetical protein